MKPKGRRWQSFDFKDDVTGMCAVEDQRTRLYNTTTERCIISRNNNDTKLTAQSRDKS